MRSIRFRLLACSILLLAGGFAISSTVVYWRLSRAMYSLVDQTLQVRVSEVEDLLVRRNGRIRLPVLTEDIDLDASDETGQTTYTRFWSLRTESARTIDPAPYSPPLSAVKPFILHALRRGSLVEMLQPPLSPKGPVRVLLVRLPRTGTPAGVVEVGISILPVEQTLSRLRAVLLLVVPPVLLLAALGSGLLLERALAPLDRLARDAGVIGAGNLSRGLEVPQTGDEVERLARVLNDMLRRLDESFQRERRFTADASHELRTPLAILQSEMDLALQSGGSAPREAIASMAQEVARMRSLVHALLELCRSDSGEMQTDREPVRLDELAELVVEQGEALAREASVTLSYCRSGPVIVLGDPARLIQVLLNLLDNAIRYSPPGQEVQVVVRTTVPNSSSGSSSVGSSNGSSNSSSVQENGPASRAEAICEIVDRGPGIAREDLPHIFERFYRADSSRSSRGAGLGLPIAQAIARAHGGRIEVESQPGCGATARLILPAIPDLSSPQGRDVHGRDV